MKLRKEKRLIVMIQKEDFEEGFVIDMMNLWCWKDDPVYEIGKYDRSHVLMIVNGILYGDEAVYSHENIDKIIERMEKEGYIVRSGKSLVELLMEGKINWQKELRKAFNSPEVTKALKDTLDVVGNILNSITKKEEKIEERDYEGMNKKELEGYLNDALERDDIEEVKKIKEYL